MTRKATRSIRIIAAYLSIAVALALLVMLGAWGARRDEALIEQAALRAELASLRAAAIRTVNHLEEELEQHTAPTLLQCRDEVGADDACAQLAAFHPGRISTAILDSAGELIASSDRPAATTPWWTAPDSDSLFRVPIELAGKPLGAYVVRYGGGALTTAAELRSSQVSRHWLLLTAAAGGIVLLAVVSLAYLTRQSWAVRRNMSQGESLHLQELGQLAAGLAHEIRNPLHAIRLNLHALGRSLEGRGQLSPDEVAAITEESNQEIDRVDRLLKALVGFAKPEAPRNETLDVGAEVQATVNFLQQEFRQKQIDLTLDVPSAPLWIWGDRSRLRQIVLQLLVNAQDAVAAGGKISVAVRHDAGRALLEICDDGPGVAELDRARVFEPFFSRKPNAAGLGLTLVRRFVREAHGAVACEPHAPRGACFRVTFPIATSPMKTKV